LPSRWLEVAEARDWGERESRGRAFCDGDVKLKSWTLKFWLVKSIDFIVDHHMALEKKFSVRI
jgi:hypothetical protein